MKTVARKTTTKMALPAPLALEVTREGGPAGSCAKASSTLHLVSFAGTLVLAELRAADRTALCGDAWARGPERVGRRGGHTAGRLVLGGRQVIVRRPRVHSLDGGGEVTLPSWAALTSRDRLDQRAVEQMLVGVSTRNCGRSLEPVAPELRAHGTSKSAVSRRFIEKTSLEVEK